MPALTTADLSERGAALGVAVLCAIGAIYLGTTLRDENHLERANAAASSGDLRGAVVEAAKVRHAPTKARALVVQAFAQLELGANAQAARTFQRAADRSPNDAQIRAGWASALLRSGRRAAAERQLARATALNPGLVLPPGFRR